MAGILGKGLEWWAGAVIGYFLLGRFITSIVQDVIGAAQNTVGSFQSGNARAHAQNLYRNLPLSS